MHDIKPHSVVNLGEFVIMPITVVFIISFRVDDFEIRFEQSDKPHRPAFWISFFRPTRQALAEAAAAALTARRDGCGQTGTTG